MLQESLNKYFLIASTGIGVYAILMVIVYLWETARGVVITNSKLYNKYVNCSFMFSLVMLIILWITTIGIAKKIMKCFFCITAGWFALAVIALILSVIVSEQESKIAVRQVIMPCIFRVIVLVGTLWLIY